MLDSKILNCQILLFKTEKLVSNWQYILYLILQEINLCLN